MVSPAPREEGTSTLSKVVLDGYVLQASGFLLNLARQLTRDKHTAEDIFQDTQVKIYANYTQLDEQTSFDGFKKWATKVLKNVFIDKRRNKKNRIHSTSKAIGTSFEGPQDPSDATESNVNVQQIHSYISQIPDKYRIPFEMHVIQGMHYSEIIETLHIPGSTLRGQVNRARELLKKLLLTEMGYHPSRSMKKKKAS